MGLTPQKAYRLKMLLAERARQKTSNSFRAYLRAAWAVIEPRHSFIPGFHLDAIADHLEAVKKREIRNLIINIPPRHAKSTEVCVAFPSWVWTDEPETKFIYASNSHPLSKRDSVKCRNVISSNWYRETFNVTWGLAEDQNEKSNFMNTAGGARIATSVGSSVIGQGGDILVLDDPHSPRSVRSEVQRAAEIEWIDQSFFTRINDPKTVCKIVIMQRLDERDACAHLLRQGDWEHLMLPAEFESERRCVTSIGWSDPREKDGDPLWPERFNSDDLGKMKKNMGSKAWAGQGQQRPAPQEGEILKRAWWRFYRDLPADISKKVISADLTFKDTEKGDFCCFEAWGRQNANKYLIDIDHGKMDFNEQLRRFKLFCLKHPDATAKYIEDAANGQALVQTTKSTIPGVIPVVPKGSKVARVESVSPQAEAGNIFLPDPTYQPHIDSGLAQKVLDFIEEAAVFPNGAHDDRVDPFSLAVSQLTEVLLDDWSPLSVTAPSKWLR